MEATSTISKGRREERRSHLYPPRDEVHSHRNSPGPLLEHILSCGHVSAKTTLMKNDGKVQQSDNYLVCVEPNIIVADDIKVGEQKLLNLLARLRIL